MGMWIAVVLPLVAVIVGFILGAVFAVLHSRFQLKSKVALEWLAAHAIPIRAADMLVRYLQDDNPKSAWADRYQSFMDARTVHRGMYQKVRSVLGNHPQSRD